MKKCRLCEGTGLIFDRNIQAGSVGELRVCDCVENQCACEGIPPYQVFDKKGVHSWCTCRDTRVKLTTTKKAFREAQIPRKYLWKFREDFKKVSNKANQLLGIVGTIRGKSPDQKWKDGFYFWGKSGTGKTLLACIILQELMLKYGTGGRFADLSRQFFQRLRNSYDVANANYGQSGQILDELILAPFIIIDDFGVQRNSEWESEMLYNLVDSRYSEERPTFITSNVPLEKFKNIAHGRIYSRILEMCKLIEFDLPDYREKYMQKIELR